MSEVAAQIFGGALDRPGSFLRDLRDQATGSYLAPVSKVPGADAAHADGLTGEGVTFAVIDTGVWHEHPWIQAALADEVDLTGEGSDDENGHGTISALIALSTAPQGKLLSIKALDRRGRSTKARLIEAIERAAALGVPIANISAGAFQPECRGDCDLCQAARRANEAGTLIVAAAGNETGETACPAKLALFGDRAGFAVAAYDLSAGKLVPASGSGNLVADVGVFELRPVG